jgi:guanylate kinase
MDPGNLFVVAAPSGAGKSSLVKALLELDARAALRLAHHARAARPGKAWPRVLLRSDAEFDAMVANNAFVEWANVHGNRYGTSKRPSKSACPGHRRAAGDRLPGRTAGQAGFANAVLIFILPPSWEELRSRLERRGEDAPKSSNCA